MGANSIFNPSTIPTPPKGKGSREDVVTPLSEVSVEKTRKTEREVLTNAAKLLTEVRSTNLVDEHKVKELRTLTVKAGKEGFKNDAERVALSHLTYQVRHLLERYEAEMAKNGPFAQAMKDANKKETKEDSNNGDDDNNNDDTPPTPYYGKREVPEGYVVPECPKELLNYGGNEQGLNADETSRGSVVAKAGKGGEGGGGN